jgi:hypothetical protein
MRIGTPGTACSRISLRPARPAALASEIESAGLGIRAHHGRNAAMRSAIVDWQDRLNADPLPWLLEPADPAVRHVALRDLVDLPLDDAELVAARRAAMAAEPIASILEAQHPEGYWEKPGAGYATKYRGTVWQLMFLDQVGADGSDERVRRGCAYVLGHSQAVTGGFGASGSIRPGPPPPSSVIHCLNGNLLRALIEFGWLEDPRVQRAVDWQARAITGAGVERWYASGTSGPGFACAANEGQPCAWGAVKAIRGLAAIPLHRRSATVDRAIQQGAAFLLGRDPAVADYPMGWGNTRPSGSWFRLGFPSAYVTDVLQNLEVLCELGYGTDSRLRNAIAWLATKQDAQGRWRNEYAYGGKTWIDIEPQGRPSKWVTLRACRVLRAVGGPRPLRARRGAQRPVSAIDADRRRRPACSGYARISSARPR